MQVSLTPAANLLGKKETNVRRSKNKSERFIESPCYSN